MAKGEISLGTTGLATTLKFGALNVSERILSISVDGPDGGTVDITNMASTGQRLFKALTLSDPGTMTVDIQLDASVDYDALVNTNGVLLLTFADTSSWSWADAIYTNWSTTSSLEETNVGSVTFKLNGAKTVA